MELGTPVWFDSGGEYPLPGRVTETYGGEAEGVQVQCVLDEKMYTVSKPKERIRIRHDALEIQHIDDMIQLRDLHEGAILFNLKTRFDKGLIYTYTGSILVAVNPYKLFDIYGIDTVKKYEGKPLGQLLPHLFAIGNSAYTRMMQTDKNQCVIISGESGAGKTESTKLIMQYLAAVNKSPSNLTTEQILEANPLLESFGNAKTVRNDNSSRFGKYTEVFFRRGVINSAKTTDYLLEKSRIVHQGPDERNYHVFYELLAGLSSPEAAKYGLRTADRYHFLNQGGSCRIEGKDDGEDFYRLVSAMEVMRFSPSEQDIIFGILASILHLGNLNMNVGQNDKLVIQNENELGLAAKFLYLRLEELERAILFRLTETRGERILTPRTLQQAIEARNGIAKSLYSSLFSWLVKSINTIVGNVGTMSSIAILDIFGFEVFQTNSFEQMCINYANEHLQYFFNKHIFMLEQQEYLKEKIPWTSIEFKDNQQCIDMIGKRPFGVIHILDDESSFPNSSDKSFMDKCHYQHMGNTCYSRAKVPSMQFSIKHFAGLVTYDMVGFLEKNRDVLKPEVVDMFINSHSQFISDIFESLRRQEEQKAMMMSSVRGNNSMRKMRASTVATRFNESLLELINTMGKCNPFFVRCIKPNSDKAPMEFDEGLVLEQLRYSGMLETISIRKMGFPIRMAFLHFANRYRFLMGPVSFKSTVKETCRIILSKAEQNDGKDYVIGTSKVFMRESLETSLEHQRSRVIRHAVVTIQKWVRRFQTRQRYLRQRDAVILIQAQIKGRRERGRYIKGRRGMIRLQALHRGRMQRRRYQQMRIHHKRMMEDRALREAEERLRMQADAARRAEEEERIAMRSDISLLEIPMELAVCMEKLAGWSNPHGERNLNKTVGQVAHQDYMFSFPLDVDEYPLSKYVHIYFKTPHFGAAIEPINTGFHKLNEMEDQEAVAIFKLILRFILEEGLSKDRELLIGNYIVQKGIGNKALRDEIYCQLCNQTWKNAAPQAQERAWLLMANLMSAFPPSKRFYKYLLKYVSDHAWDGYKSYCHQKLLLCDTQALEFLIPRTYPPCFLEWKANRQRCNMALVAELPDGEEVTVMADSWSTGEDFARSALQKKGITKACHGWSVYVMEDKTRSELSGYDYIMDLISEMEIPPDFPVRESQFLVSSETVHDRLPNRKFKVLRNNLAQIDALLEMDPAALNAHIPPPPTGPPPPVPKTSPSKPPAPPAPPPPPPPTVGSGLGVESRQKRPSTSSRPRSEDVEYASTFFNPGERWSSKPVFPGNIHIPEPDYDLPPEEDQRYNVYDDTDIGPSSPIHPTLNSDGSDNESDQNHNVARQIRAVSVPNSGSRHRLDDYVDRLFNPVLEMNGAADLANAAKVNKALRGGGRGPAPSPTPPPLFVPPPPQLSTGLPPSPMAMPGFPSMATTPAYTPGMLQPTLPTVPAHMPAAMPAAMPMTVPMMPHQPTLFEAAIQQQQQQAAAQQAAAQQVAAQQAAAQHLAAQQAASQQLAAQQAAAQQLAAQQAVAQQVAAQQAAAQQAAAQQAAAQQAVVHQAVQQHQQRQQQEAMMQHQAAYHQQTIMAQQVQLQQQQQMLQDIHSKLSATTPASDTGSLKSSLAKSHDARNQSSSKGSPPPSPLRKKNLHFSNQVVNIPRESSEQANTGQLRSEVPRSPVKGPKPGFVPAPPPLPPPPPSPPSESEMVKVRTRSGKVVPLNDSYRANTVRVGRVVWPPRKEEELKSSGVQIDWDKDALASDAGQLDEQVVSRNYQPTSEIKKAIHAAHKSKGMAPEASLQTLISARAKQLQGKSEETTAKPVQRPRPLKSALKTPPPVKPKKLTPRPSPNKLNVQDVHAEAMAKILARKATLDRRSPQSPPVTPAPPPPRTASKPLGKTPPAPPPPPPPISTIPSIRAKAEAFQQSQPVARSESKREGPKRIIPKKQEVHNEAMHILQSRGHRVRTNTDYDKEVVVPLMSPPDVEQLESPRTKAFPSIPDVFYTYNRVRWRLHIRKEVFTPGERLENPMAQQLVFYQIVADTFSKSCIRMSMEEKRQVKAVLDAHGVNQQNAAQKSKMRKDVIEMARKFPLYFCRFFAVTGGRKNRQVEILGVSENGISLVKREYDQTRDQLTQLDHISFSDIKQIEVSVAGTIRITLTNDKVIPLFTHRAQLIKGMIEAYIIDLERDSQYMRAIQDYITRESTLLSFRKGDIIKLTARHPAADSDWLFGMLDGRTGFFPKESVIPAPGPESRNLLVRRGIAAELVISNQEEPRRQKQEARPSAPKSPERQPTQEELTRFSMVEFASKYFRENPNKYVMQRKEDGSIRGSLKFMGNFKRSRKKNSKKKPIQVDEQDYTQFLDAVSYTNSPIQVSLLEFPVAAINKLSLECFLALMKIMGDYPLRSKQDTPIQQALYEKIIFIIKACFGHREMCDEIYCHVIKQTTRNTSTKKLSLLHAWRFFTLLTAFFRCSPTLKPYLFQYLTMVAQTAEFQYGGMAGVCLFNLRKSFRHGGRRLLPGPEEVGNLLAGRLVRRQQVHLPGNLRTMVKVSNSSVVVDILEELCTEMGIQQPAAIEEFGIFGLVPQKNKVVPLQLSDYLMDVTNHFEKQGFEYALLFKKVVWYQPMSVSNEFASATIYNQVLPDYQSGRLVVLEFNTLTEQQKAKIVRLAILMHRAADKVQIPTVKDLPDLLPANVINHINSQQWLNLIHSELPLLESMSPHLARTEFVNTVIKWRLFGSSFFDVVHVSDSRVGGGCLLAINKTGVHFLHPQSHEVLVTHGFHEVVSSHHLKGDGRQYVDLKCGNLMVQKVTRIQTNQCTEIINVIGQHMQRQVTSGHQPDQPDSIADFNNLASPKYPPSQGQESPNNPAKRWGGVATPIQEVTKQSNVARSPSALSDYNRGANVARSPSALSDYNRAGSPSGYRAGSPSRLSPRRPSPASSISEPEVSEPRPSSPRRPPSPFDNRPRQLDSNWVLAPKDAERGHARMPSWDRSSGSARDSSDGEPYNRSSPVLPPASSGNILKMGMPRSAATRQASKQAAPAVANGNLHGNRMGRGAVPGAYNGRK
ncbi:unconventional myosin-XV-like [Patiria miniata]|uniref:Unconventional myosin-XV n=1 Tax=Patiria miniata TaxID=46514 RepID=A0A914AL56_PATMI|nr:unconventional myosin-XV-like [Patiria miniata]